MAPSSPPPPSPPSASNTQNAASHPIKVEEGGGTNGAVSNVADEKPDFSHFHVEYMDKYKRYEADYTRRLMAKYFSKKNLYGGNIFDERMTIDDETIMSSRWPCTRSFADPVKGFEEQGSAVSTSTSET